MGHLKISVYHWVLGEIGQIAKNLARPKSCNDTGATGTKKKKKLTKSCEQI